MGGWGQPGSWLGGCSASVALGELGFRSGREPSSQLRVQGYLGCSEPSDVQGASWVPTLACAPSHEVLDTQEQGLPWVLSSDFSSYSSKGPLRCTLSSQEV